MTNIIEIDSINPYESLFPGRKLVNKDTLRIVKYLRQQGKVVIFRPNNKQPVEYLFQKGFAELLQQPIFLYFATITGSVAADLLTDVIKRLFANRNNDSSIDTVRTKVIINTRSRNYYFDGKRCNYKEIKKLARRFENDKKEFTKLLNARSPYKKLETPIFLEHKPKIIGWGRYELTDEGFITKENRITDKKAWERIKSGEIRGGSLTGIASKCICNICNESYIVCDHVAGDEYDGKLCLNTLSEAEVIEFSLVRHPVNPECLINFEKDF